MKTGTAVLFALVTIFALLFMSAAPETGTAAQAMPAITKFPHITLSPLLPAVAVDIPDANLDAALHNATGVPAGEDLHPTDLAGLTGMLNLNAKNITNAEGLQFCVNVTRLILSSNNISTLPIGMKDLVNLKNIDLGYNAFTSFPAVLLEMPNLEVISLERNSLTGLPDSIRSITGLKELQASHNRLSSLPASLGQLANLERVYLSSNRLTQVPRQLFNAPKLTMLDLSKNQIASIPAEAFSAPMLKTLYLYQNRIREIPAQVKDAPALQELLIFNNLLTNLPAGIGNAPVLSVLNIDGNSLTTVEESLCSGRLSALYMTNNKIRSLPDYLRGASFDCFTVAYNYLDVSSGSPDRSILDSLTVNTFCSFDDQLSPVKFTDSSSTQDAITLKWNALADGSDASQSYEWKVLKYDVYDSTASPAKLLASLGKTSGGYTLDGLDAGKEYRLFVRVYYEFTVQLGEGDGTLQNTTSCDTGIRISTKAADAPTPSPSAAPSAATPSAGAPSSGTLNTVVPTAGTVFQTVPSATATESSAAGAASSQGLLIALVAVGAAIALALVALIVVLLKRRPPSPSGGR